MKKGKKVKKLEARKPPEVSVTDRTWSIVCEMEDPLIEALDFAETLALVTEALDDDGRTAVVQRLAHTISARLRIAEDLRAQLFHLTHPGKAKVLAAAM